MSNSGVAERPAGRSHRTLPMIFALVGACFVVLLVNTLLIRPLNKKDRVVSDPGAEFTKLTGLNWPSDAKIISVGDDHGGFNGDGEFHLVFETDAKSIRSFLESSPPWQGEWVDGPVPTEIGFHCRF